MSEANFSNRWREGAEQILSEKKAKSSPPTLVSKRAKNNPTKEEYQKRAIDAGKFIAEMTPIIGDAMAAKEVYDEIQREDTNWFLVGALGGATILGLIPGVGDAAARLVKKGAKRAFDVSKRIEIDLNVLGSTGGNIKIKPEDITDVQAKKIQKILKKEKNVNDNFYMLHGGTDFDKIDLKASGLGEPGSFRPLGRGIYGSRIVDPKNIETIKNAYLQASKFAGHFGTSITGNYAGFSHPLYKEAFKDVSLPIETTESLLKELQEKVPIEVTTEQVGKIHLFKVPRTKELKVYDFKKRKGIAQNTEDIEITYPREFSSRFTIASPKFGDSQVVLQPLGEVEEMAIHDTNIVERLTKLDLPEEFFETINKRKLRKNELNPNYPYDYIVDKKLENLKKEAQYIADRENLNPKTMEINLLKDLQNKGHIDKSLNIDELPEVNYPEDVENLVNQEDFLKEMQKDIEVSRRNVFVPEDRLELGEDSTQLLGLDSGKRIPKRTVEYNKGGFNQSKNSMFKKGGMTMATEDQQTEMMLMLNGGMKDDGMDRDPVSGNEVPPGSLAKEVRDDIPAQLSDGEYVVPADVVQYFGVKFFEDLRIEAKQGLEQMQSNGRIGGEPVPESANNEMGGLPFDISELKTKEDAPTMNRGGIIKADEGVYVPKLDFSNLKGLGSGGGSNYQTRQYVAAGCKVKPMLITNEGATIQEADEGYVDVTSDAGLNILKNCPNINLSQAEKDIIGADVLKQIEDGTYKPDPIDDTPVEKKQVQKNDDDDDDDSVNQTKAIKEWQYEDMEKYIGDVSNYYNRYKSEGNFVSNIFRSVLLDPINKFNQPYIMERTIQLMEAHKEDPEKLKMLSQVFKHRFGKKPKDVIELPSGKTLTFDPKTGLYENPEVINLKNILGEESYNNIKVNINKDILNRSEDRERASLDDLQDRFKDTGFDNQFAFSDFNSAADQYQAAVSKYKTKKQNELFANDPTLASEQARGTMAGAYTDDSTMPTSVSPPTENIAQDFFKNRKNEDQGDKGFASENYAKSLMNEKNDGASAQVEYDQYNKEEADLSDAYGGGEAAEKFKQFNKGGLAKKRKTTKKK